MNCRGVLFDHEPFSYYFKSLRPSPVVPKQTPKTLKQQHVLATPWKIPTETWNKSWRHSKRVYMDIINTMVPAKKTPRLDSAYGLSGAPRPAFDGLAKTIIMRATPR